MNKSTRRRLIGMGAVAGFVSVAVAVPVGIVYGIRNGQSEAPTVVEHDLSKLQNGSIDYKWGQRFSETVPSLDERTGYKSADYVGAFAGSGFDETKTPIGTGVTTVVYKYTPVDGKTGPTVYVTYSLNVSKGVSLDLSKFTPSPKTIPYSSTVLPVEDLDSLLSVTGYGYKQSSTVPVEYKKSDGTPLTAAELAALAVGQVFSATYTMTIDTDHYEAAASDGTALPATVSYVQSYAIVPIPSIAPAISTEAPRTIEMGAFTGTAFPANQDKDEDYPGYVQSPATPTAVVTTASTLSASGNYVSPPVGHPVTVSEINTYNAGTEFTVTYSYKNDANHAAASFSVPRIFKIVKRQSTAPKQAMLPTSQASYATTTDADGNVPLPTATAPALPNLSSLGVAGYDNGTYSYLLETTPTDKPLKVLKSNKLTNADVTHSPDVGTMLGWDELASLNAGVQIGIDVTYKPLYEYDGDPVTITRSWDIVKQIATNEAADFDESSTDTYTHGTDPEELLETLQESAAVQLYTPDGYIYVNGDFYAGDKPVAQPTILTAEAVMKLNPGDKFSVRLTFRLNDNYTAAAGSDDTFYYRVAYTVS